MDKSDFFFEYSICSQLSSEIIIYIELPVIFWSGDITENKLGQFLFLMCFP